MASNIDVDALRKKVKNEFNNKQGKMEKEDKIKLYDIVTEITKKERIFRNLPKPLENLVHNILYIQMYNRIISKDIDYNEDSITTRIIESINQTDTIIDIIKETAEELSTRNKKGAFYGLMENNHIIMASIYISRKKFYDSSINILCKSINIPELDDKMTPEDAIIKLCELTQSKKYSRLQRVLDILMKHGNNLIITDKNGVKHSNASRLGLNNDDIKSLQLLTRIDEHINSDDFSKFLEDSIYGSICDKIKQDGRYYSVYSIYKLYSIVYDISKHEDEIDTPYKADIIDDLKEYLNDLNNNERVCSINDIINKSDIFNNIIKNGLTTNEFKNNVIQKYLESIELNISIITSTVIPFKHKFKRVLSIIIVIFITILIIILCIIGIFPNETKQLLNNLNN
ncbi:hypothetical protein NEIG_01510 [Nematocida sp. ERTm5]|nr:hypothetical protein NEIG_01510 [Nematocida sp. ERTm5]